VGLDHGEIGHAERVVAFGHAQPDSRFGSVARTALLCDP